MYWSPSTRTALAEAELEYPEESFAFQSICIEPGKRVAGRTMSRHPFMWHSSALRVALSSAFFGSNEESLNAAIWTASNAAKAS